MRQKFLETNAGNGRAESWQKTVCKAIGRLGSRAIGGTRESNRDVLKLPALAKVGLDELIRLLVVGESQVLAVPQQLLIGESPAYRAQQHPFGIRAGDGEIGTRGLAAFAGSNPVLEVPGRFS